MYCYKRSRHENSSAVASAEWLQKCKLLWRIKTATKTHALFGQLPICYFLSGCKMAKLALIGGSDDCARKSNTQLDQWPSGKLCTGSRVQSSPCAFPLSTDVSVLLLDHSKTCQLKRVRVNGAFPVSFSLSRAHWFSRFNLLNNWLLIGWGNAAKLLCQSNLIPIQNQSKQSRTNIATRNWNLLHNESVISNHSQLSVSVNHGQSSQGTRKLKTTQIFKKYMNYLKKKVDGSWCCENYCWFNFMSRCGYYGSFPFVRTDRPDPSRGNENFTINQNYPARFVKSYMACRKEMVFRQKPLENVDCIVKMTVRPASSDKWKASYQCLFNPFYYVIWW